MSGETGSRFGPRLAPGGSPIPARALLRALCGRDSRDALVASLGARFPGRRVSLHASGRDAMRVALAQLARQSGRSEVAIPAYGCFSIPASVVAAGLRVRLVDVDEQGRLAPAAFARLPLDRLAAIVVGNLFGLPESIEAIAEPARAAGVALVDDAAQALGARALDGAVGARGVVGILSFGRGKPLSALGGGAALWSAALPDDACGEFDAPGASRRLAAALRGLAYDVSRQPLVLGLLASIPALGIGKTVFDPAFEQGVMDGAALGLAAALAPELDRLNEARRATALQLADRIRQATAFTPLVEAPGTLGVYPRLGLLAPSGARRDQALAGLVQFGATAMYPSPMDAIRALVPHRADHEDCPGAQAFCDRLLTLPTHPGPGDRRLDAVVERLAAS